MSLDIALLLQKAEVLPIAKVGSILLRGLFQEIERMRKIEDIDILIQVQGRNQSQNQSQNHIVILKGYFIIL